MTEVTIRKEAPSLVYLFSLPRSGSTLLQRILASSPLVATAAEPWMLLHLVYMMRRDGIETEYRQQGAVDAYEDFFEMSVDKGELYYACVRAFALQAYSKKAGAKATYFLDKTPRYCLIIPEIIKIFPNSSRIYLFRHPLDIIASIVKTWGNDKWIIKKFEIDLIQGMNNLVKSAMSDENGLLMFYEKLTDDQLFTSELSRAFGHIGVPVPSHHGPDKFDLSQNFIPGRMGDPKRYFINKVDMREINQNNIINNIFRYRWLKYYLEKLNPSTRSFLEENYNVDIECLRPSSWKLGAAIIDAVIYYYHSVIDLLNGSNLKIYLRRKLIFRFRK